MSNKLDKAIAANLGKSFEKAFRFHKADSLFPSMWRVVDEPTPPMGDCPHCGWLLQSKVSFGWAVVFCLGCGCVWDGGQHE